MRTVKHSPQLETVKAAKRPFFDRYYPVIMSVAVLALLAAVGWSFL